MLEFLNNLWGLGTARLHTTQPGGIGSLESILRLLISLSIRANLICALPGCGAVLSCKLPGSGAFLRCALPDSGAYLC